MENIDNLLKELTLEEKVCLISGHKSWHSVKIPRLNIPSLFITDGPHGLRKKKENSKELGLGQTELSTCFPAASTTGTSWNKELLFKMGEAMGKECNHYDVHVILGPAVNIKRNPLCGRSFEYFSEDPLIAGLLGGELTRGIESRNVGTSVKHYACNNNEGNRYFGDSIVDERALREIYLKVFEHIVKKGKPATLMCAYNKINGEYASENEFILNKVLRDEWGFKGLVMSDWGAVNNRVKGLNAGLDLEMPGDIIHNRNLIFNAVKNGEISEEVLNKSVKRILEMVFKYINSPSYVADFEEHSNLSKELALDSAVLLKNENNLLPLKNDQKYLVVGEMFTKMRYQGAGSSLIRPTKIVRPVDSFVQNNVNHQYFKGYNVNSFDVDEELEKEVLDNIKDYETILFFGGLSEEAESEGFDRKNMDLPFNQVHLIEEIIKLNKKVIFIMYGGSPVELPFESEINSILNMYLPGQEGGNATYQLLFGKVSPSGRLCETWPIKYQDVPFGNELTKTTNDLYKESIFVGYRYYSTYDVPVRYPFGYGLSYSSFEYKNMEVIKEGDYCKVSVEVTNTGNIEASEVIQIYSKVNNSSILRPKKELKGFTKVKLLPRESKKVSVIIPLEDLKVYLNGWVLESGTYTFEINKNVNEVILEKDLLIQSNDQIISTFNLNKYYSSKEQLLNITQEDFEEIIGRKITLEEVKKPYHLNTPIAKFNTFFGKALFKLMKGIMKMGYKAALKEKDSEDKETKVKNAYFAMKTMESMSFRAISYSSEGGYPHRMAEGFVDIANNKVFKGIYKMMTPEKGVKLPPQE